MDRLISRLREPSPADWVIAGALAGLCVIEIWVEPIFENGLPGPRGPLTVLALTATLSLAWRRVHALAVLGLVMAASCLVAVVARRDLSGFELFVAILLATYAAGAALPGRAGRAGGAIGIGGAVVYSLLTLAEGDGLADVLVPLGIISGAWLAGREMQRHRRRAARLADHASVLQAEVEQRERAAGQAERARIARELHDVVSHGISLMGIQAAAARRTLQPGQAEPAEALLLIERTGREALTEMERMLGVLRADTPDSGGPLPRLEHLDRLVDDARRAEHEVALDVTGQRRELAPGLELNAYRILQEALTNARKHAPGSRLQVRVDYRPAALTLEVRDDGAGPPDASPGRGHGLVGVRERVEMHGGRLELGSPPGGGFQLRATLPIEAAE